MEVLLILVGLYWILGALKRKPVPAPTITIRIQEIGPDDRGPRDPRPRPRHEPEIEIANRRARERV